MSSVLVLSSSREPAAEILPSLSLLPHTIRVLPADAEMVTGAPEPDAVLVDARRDLVQVRQLFLLLRGTGLKVPVLAIVTEGGWAAVTAEWGADDLILHTAGPGEVEARLRLAIGRRPGSEPVATGEVKSGELVINEVTYSARMHGRALDLTFKEFELLKFLAQHPRRVFTRSQLLQEVWGYDYFGGTRTVDVHVRRLRAKLGAENEALIGTVRNVGYRFVPAKTDGPAAGPASAADQQTDPQAHPLTDGANERQGRPSRTRRSGLPGHDSGRRGQPGDPGPPADGTGQYDDAGQYDADQYDPGQYDPGQEGDDAGQEEARRAHADT